MCETDEAKGTDEMVKMETHFSAISWGNVVEVMQTDDESS